MVWNVAPWVLGLFCCGVVGASGPVAKGGDLPPVSPLTAEAVNHALKEKLEPNRRPDPPDRLYAVGAGLGVPNLLTLEASLQLLRRWQVGVGVGILPAVSGLIPPIDLPPQSITLIDNNTYTVNGVATTNLELLLPFVRYFPTRRTTYLQVSATLLRSTHVVTSDLVNEATQQAVPGAQVTADMVFTHILPTVSLGHFFWNSIFYMNISLGGTFLLSSTSSIQMRTNLPGPLGGSIANLPQIQNLEAAIDRELATAVERVRSQVAIIPSLAITFGVMF